MEAPGSLPGARDAPGKAPTTPQSLELWLGWCVPLRQGRACAQGADGECSARGRVRGNRILARAWRGHGAGYRQSLAWGGAGMARAWHGQALSPQRQTASRTRLLARTCTPSRPHAEATQRRGASRKKCGNALLE
eukprot:gene19101-biopygen14535